MWVCPLVVRSLSLHRVFDGHGGDLASAWVGGVVRRAGGEERGRGGWMYARGVVGYVRAAGQESVGGAARRVRVGRRVGVDHVQRVIGPRDRANPLCEHRRLKGGALPTKQRGVRRSELYLYRIIFSVYRGSDMCTLRNEMLKTVYAETWAP